MENASKALIIAGAIMLTILLVLIGMFLYNKSYGAIVAGVDSSQVDMRDTIYLTYEGKQMGHIVKQLLRKACDDNEPIYKSSTTIDECICLRTSCESILSQVNDIMKTALDGTRSYGVRYPSNIRDVMHLIDGRKQYLVEFTFNDETGNIWEIWIHDAL